MTPILASSWNLAWPDLIVMTIIIAVLAAVAVIPAVIALPIVFIISRSSKKPSPLPLAVQLPRSVSPPDTTSEGIRHDAVVTRKGKVVVKDFRLGCQKQ
jgi:hypothetical protein